MKLNLLYELLSRTTKVSDFGGTHDGPRADVHLEGEVKGRVSGKFHGIDYGLSRTTGASGVVVVHVHETITTDDGLISVMRRGYAIPDGDNGYRIRASCLFQTGSKKFEFLNTTLGLAEGHADAEKVELSVFEVL
jgi:Protein of unknown function (DUF3237)